jgi:hypothetical protein
MINYQRNPKSMTTPYTPDEIKIKFMEMIKAQMHYWNSLDMPAENKLNGLGFAICSLLDGTVGNMPAFDVVVRASKEFNDCLRENGERSFEDGTLINPELDLYDTWDSIKVNFPKPETDKESEDQEPKM